jgi:epsilon-lactone hydrolase
MERPMSEIDSIRAVLSAKPRPVGWAERRARIDEVGSVWPVAHDIQLMPVDLGGLRGELSTAPGSDPSRMLLFFHGGGYCSGSIVSHRRMVTEAGRAARMATLAVEYRLAPENPFPSAHEDTLTAWRYLRAQGIAPRHIAVGGDSAGGNLRWPDQPAAGRGRAAASLCVAGLTMDRPHHVGRLPHHERRDRSAHPQGLP